MITHSKGKFLHSTLFLSFETRVWFLDLRKTYVMEYHLHHMPYLADPNLQWSITVDLRLRLMVSHFAELCSDLNTGLAGTWSITHNPHSPCIPKPLNSQFTTFLRLLQRSQGVPGKVWVVLPEPSSCLSVWEDMRDDGAMSGTSLSMSVGVKQLISVLTAASSWLFPAMQLITRVWICSEGLIETWNM